MRNSNIYCKKKNRIKISGFFVPLYEYHQTPKNHEEKLQNVNLALSFMEEIDFKSRNRSSEIVQGNSRAIMRVLYHLFAKHNKTDTK